MKNKLQKNRYSTLFGVDPTNIKGLKIYRKIFCKKKANPRGVRLEKNYENNKKTYASASAASEGGGAIVSPSGFGSAALTSACASAALLRYSSGSVGVNSPLAIL